jgi:hypothetical protein
MLRIQMSCDFVELVDVRVLSVEPDKTQSEHLPQYQTAFFLQQLTFPQSVILARLSNKR